MLLEAYYFRDPSFLYSLQSHCDYWFHVGKSDTRQVIIGFLANRLYAVMFNGLGDFLEVQDWSLPVVPSSTPGGIEQLQDLIEQEVRKYREVMGLTDETIRVKRFRLPNLRVGIDDLPDDLQELVLHPEHFEAAERPELEDALEAWKEEEEYVFWWEEDFYVDREGLVASS